MTERGKSGLGAGALLMWAAVSLSACDVYDASRLKSPTAGNPGDDAGMDAGAGGTGGGGGAGAGGTTPLEICNDVDDDHDEITDESTATKLDCMLRRPHAADVACTNGTCIFTECEPGYLNADGNKGNGCETQCANAACDDAGIDDSGTADGG